MARYRVFTSVGDMGIGASLAKSRRRLLISSAILTAGYVAYAVITTDFMRTSSSSTALNLFFISGAMLQVMVLAYVHGMVVADLLFPGMWRRRVILGEKIEIGEDEELREIIGKFRDHSIPFWGVFVLMLVFNYLLYGWVTSGFLDDYDDWGYHQTLLRSEEPDDRIRGIRKLVHPRESQAILEPVIREALIGLINDTDGEVAQWAMWALGELRVYEAIDPLSATVLDRSQSAADRARAAESLGALSRDGGAERFDALGRAVRRLAELLIESFGDEELALGLLRALGIARLPDTATLIEPMTHVGPSEIRAYAFWALGRTGNRDFRDEILSTIERGSQEDRCYAAEALKFVTDREDLINSHTLFSVSPEDPCDEVIWRSPYHWDDDGSFRMDIVVSETLRAKFLKAVFTAAGCTDRSVSQIPPSCLRERDFFAEVSNDEAEAENLRRLARELAVRIDQAHR
jgi:hypothetical protein